MRRLIYILFAVVLSMGVSAQSASRADELFGERDYYAALQIYESLLRNYPQNSLYQYRYARCLQETGRTEAAIKWFETAGERYALRNYYLGLLYAETYRFSESVLAMEKYIPTIDSTHERYDSALSALTYSRKGERYLRHVDDIEIIDSVTVVKSDFLRAYKLSEESGSLHISNSAVAFTNSRGDRQLLDVKRQTADTAFHTLVSCQRLLEDWSDYDTLPQPINGVFDAAFPFMMADGLTLYFASNSADGLGGYDIYRTRYNPTYGTWSQPNNIGFPYNSSANDYMFAVDEQQGVGYFATDRRSAADSVVVYKFYINQELRFVKDTNEQYVREAAQLKAWRTTTAQTAEIVIVEDNNIQQDNRAERSTWQIVINDSTVYTSLDDFLSQEARRMAEEYLGMQLQIEEEKQFLQAQRELYAEADAEQRQSLRMVILTEEKTLRSIQKDATEQLKKLISLEQQK